MGMIMCFSQPVRRRLSKTHEAEGEFVCGRGDSISAGGRHGEIPAHEKLSLPPMTAR